MTIWFDTTDVQRIKFNTTFYITKYNIYSSHFIIFSEFFIYKYIHIKEKISTSHLHRK